MIAIIANPNALRFNLKELKSVVEKLEKSGVCADIFFTQKAGDGSVIAGKLSSKYDVIAAYGGDGIINEIINADLKTSALGIIPAGTTNVLAMDLGISLNQKKAADLLINPKTKKAYLGCINDKKFILMAGVGFDAETVKNVNYKLKKISGKLSYFVAGFVSYFKSKNTIINLKIGNKSYKARWVIVSKAKKYAGNFLISNFVDIDIPVFDVCIFEPIKNNFTDLPYYNLALFGMLHLLKIPFVKHIATKESIHISKSNVQIDGDFFGFTEVDIKICEKPISIVVP